MKYSQERPLSQDAGRPRLYSHVDVSFKRGLRLSRYSKNAHRDDMDVFGKSFLVSVSNLMLDKLLFKQTF